MVRFWRAVRVMGLLALINWRFVPEPLASSGAGTVLLLLFFVFLFVPRLRQKGASRRLRVMLGGYELLLDGFLVLFCQLTFTVVYAARHGLTSQTMLALVPPLLFGLLFCGLILVDGFFRVVFTSKHLRIVWRVLLLTLWWLPLFHIWLFAKVLHTVRSEYYFTLAHDAVLKDAEGDCRTKYPIVLVHGIFFRDWQLINYWGRIPRALEQCGAQVFYGGQQSSAPVAEAGAELAARIREILEQTGAEKVNLIAHSKGGLDSRWAITHGGLSEKVASLTTINTPHRGCVWARHLLEHLPKGVLGGMERKYNAVFRKLGDKSPDFMGGVRDLTDTAAAVFNEQTPDVPAVCYRSVMSTMKKASSAGFPLNFCYRLVKKYDHAANDGLVARESAPWGEFCGEITVPGRRGISHGDVVDLMREDIAGFDVCAFYVKQVSVLRERGF